jgi:hypothetical protein
VARHFTAEEANAELARIRPLVEELVAARSEQQRLASVRLELAAKVAGNGGGLDPRVVNEAREAEGRARVAVASCVNAIHGHGAIVKDLDEGLIDFPAIRDGAEILLCWRLGEEEVAYWHGLEEGFAGRKRIDPE